MRRREGAHLVPDLAQHARGVKVGGRLGIGNTVAAAEVQILGKEAGFAVHVGDEGQHHLRRLDKRRAVENLRADVAVEALQTHAGKRERALDKRHSLPGLDGGAEFGIDRAGDDLFMRMRIDARRNAQQDVLHLAVRAGDAVEREQLVLVVDDEGAHPDVQRVGDIRVGFVVAVEIDVLRIKAGLAGGIQLAGRNDVRADPLRRGDAVDVHIRQRLRGEQHAAARGEAYCFGACPRRRHRAACRISRRARPCRSRRHRDDRFPRRYNYRAGCASVIPSLPRRRRVL